MAHYRIGFERKCRRLNNARCANQDDSIKILGEEINILTHYRIDRVIYSLSI